MPIPLEEYLTLALLLLGVIGSYILLKLHYIFAFGLVKNTSLSQEKKEKIEKIKTYVFAFLKVLFVVGFTAMLYVGVVTLYEGESLKAWVVSYWAMIPEGFWLDLLWVLIRIAILIVLMRIILKYIYAYLDRQQERTLAKKRYNTQSVDLFYLRLHNTIKFTVVLGVIYRIVHFFPFLEEVSYLFLFALILFFSVASLITIRELIKMLKTRI
jgi:magnesium-transporting ATPase (P-type)